jgi:diadenosine tetraphosphate (Ap4A) HIT family hydrolase
MSRDPFCVRAMLDETIFYESRHFFALYDARPVVKGHCLFIPKRHVTDILELRSDELADLHDLFDAVVPRLLRLYRATKNSYDVALQIGPYSGRSISHIHIHVLPRVKGDDYQSEDSNIFDDIKMKRTKFSRADVENEVRRLRGEFRYKPARR